MNKNKIISVLFFILFVLSVIFTISTRFDEISVPYFKGIRRSIQTDVIFKNKPTEILYDNNSADISIKINDYHYLFGEKTYKKISKIKFGKKESIKELLIFKGNTVKKYENIPDEIKIDNEKNIMEKSTITFLSFFYNYKLFLLSYLFLILAVTFSNLKFNHKTTFYLITFLAILLRITQLNEIPFCDDEIYILTHTGNCAKLIEMFQDPGNPPFYFIVFKIWRSIIQNENYYRFLSVIAGVLFNICFYIYIKNWLGKTKALTAYFMVAISLILIYFSQEIRCYMFLILFSITSAILLFKYNHKTKILYLINSILLLNTHFYGALIWLFNLIYGISIFYKKKNRIKSFLINNTISFLIFIPNILFKINSITSEFNTWIKKPDLRGFIEVLQNFSVSLIVFCLFLFVLFYLYKKTKTPKTKLFLKYNILAIVSVIVFSLIFSLTVKSIFHYRYFYVIYPFYLALCTYVVCFEYKTIFKFFIQFLFFILFCTTARLNTQNLYNNSDLYFNLVRQDLDSTKTNYVFLNNTLKNYKPYENAFQNKAQIIYLKVDVDGVVDINPLEKNIKTPCVCYILNLYLKDEVYSKADDIELYKTPLGLITKVIYN